MVGNCYYSVLLISHNLLLSVLSISTCKILHQGLHGIFSSHHPFWLEWINKKNVNFPKQTFIFVWHIIKFIVIGLQSNNISTHTFTPGVDVHLWCPHLHPIAIHSCSFPLVSYPPHLLLLLPPSSWVQMWSVSLLTYFHPRCCCKWTGDAFILRIVSCVVRMRPWTLLEAARRIRSQTILNMFRVYSNLYPHVPKRYPIAIRSQKMHFNAECKRALDYLRLRTYFGLCHNSVVDTSP